MRNFVRNYMGNFMRNGVRTYWGIACLLLFVAPVVISAQKRVVVLPFRNMDGEVAYNPWRYELADSLRTAILAVDPAQKAFTMVDQDSVELAISELNLDPNNAQYESDVWRAVKNLNADLVVSGNFFLRGERVLRPETVALLGMNHMGDNRVSLLKAAIPLTNDAEFFPGVPKSWSLAFQVNHAPLFTGRPAG